MHATAIQNAERFFETYPIHGAAVLDIGSQDVNGSIRSVCPYSYVGIDSVPGRGVDVVLNDPYKIPLEVGSVDIVVSSSCFEHSELFWVLFLEVLRVLKPHGLFYLNAPSNGDIHRFPVDCWRFYPDAAGALVKWGRLNGYAPRALESYTSNRRGSVWNDYVAVFVKDENFADHYPDRIMDNFSDFRNGSGGRRSTPFAQDQASFFWLLRRVGHFVKTPGAASRSVEILGDVLARRRRRVIAEF